MIRRLYRCRENRLIAGVASGVAEHLGLDPSLVRILWLASVFFGGLGIFLYVAMILIVPLEPLSAEAAAAHAAAAAAGTPYGHRHEPGSGRLLTFIGFVLLLIGGLALIDVLLPGWATWRQLWPLLFVGAGAFLLFLAMRRESSPAAGNGPPPPPTGAPLGNGTTVTES